MCSRLKILSFSPLAAACLLTLTLSSGCVGPMAAGIGGCGSGSCGTSCGGSSCGDAGCTGCGELYVDPWINHPPQCGDPCDSCGNFNGQSCGKCRSVFDGVKSFWGYRCGPQSDCDSCDGGSCGPLFPIGDCGSCGGCDSCGDCGSCNDCGSCDCSPGGYLEHDHSCGCDSCGGGEIHSTSPVIESSIPTVYRPRRERKIFQPRQR